MEHFADDAPRSFSFPLPPYARDRTPARNRETQPAFVPTKLETQTHSTRRFVSSLNKKNKSSWRHRCSSRARAKDLRTSAVERKPPLCRDIKSVPLCFAGPLQRQLPLLLELGNHPESRRRHHGRPAHTCRQSTPHPRDFDRFYRILIVLLFFNGFQNPDFSHFPAVSAGKSFLFFCF